MKSLITTGRKLTIATILAVNPFTSITCQNIFALAESRHGLSAVKEKGPLMVQETVGMSDCKNGTCTFRSQDIPWSSNWYMSLKTDLFDDKMDKVTKHGKIFKHFKRNKAPLKQYDRFVDKKYDRDTHAAKIEQAYYEVNKARSGPWEGHCRERAFASILFPGPLAAIKPNGVEFQVGDIQALLTKSAENIVVDLYGSKNGASSKNFKKHDIYPHEVVRLIQTELRDGKRPFVINYIALPPEVYNVAVFEATLYLSVQKDENGNPAIDPKTGLNIMNGVSHFTWTDLDMNSEFDRTLYAAGEEDVIKRKTYNFNLYGHLEANGQMRVEKSKWTKDSIEQMDHPDYIILMPTDEALRNRRSNNEDIDNKIVNELYALSREAAGKPLTATEKKRLGM